MYADRLSRSVFAADRARRSCCLSIAMLIFVVGTTNHSLVADTARLSVRASSPTVVVEPDAAPDGRQIACSAGNARDVSLRSRLAVPDEGVVACVERSERARRLVDPREADAQEQALGGFVVGVDRGPQLGDALVGEVVQEPVGGLRGDYSTWKRPYPERYSRIL